MKFLSYLIVASLMAASCSQKGEKKEDLTNAESGASELKLVDGLTLDGDSVMLPPFEVEIQLSPKAEAKLSKDNETIIVQAYLSGVPRDSISSKLIDEMGEINLGSPRVELIKPGIAKFKGIKVSKEAYALLGEKDFQVLINVFSGRKSTESNLLNCDILQEPITVVKVKKHILKGKLIGE